MSTQNASDAESLKTNGLIFGKFSPPHNGHLHLIQEALSQVDGDVYLLIYDHPEIDSIPTHERASLIKTIISNSRLKIFECYDSPLPGNSLETRHEHMVNIRSRLPNNIKIHKVFCSEDYGYDAAEEFDAEWIQIDPKGSLHDISGTKIKQSSVKNSKHLHPLIAARILNARTVVAQCDIQFTGSADIDELNKPLTPEETEQQRREIIALNTDKKPSDLFIMKPWDTAEFDQVHLPVIVGRLQDASGFSTPKGLRILDMAIRMPNQGWAFPTELTQFKEAVVMAFNHEKMINPNIDQYFAYITIDQKIVQPDKTQRRPGYHSDAYETSETDDNLTSADNTYIVYDAIPTHFQAGPFAIDSHVDPEDCEAVLNHFDKLAEKVPPVTYSTYTMLKLTPYDVHSPALNEEGHSINRTFIKITFSRKSYNLIGNRINNTPDKNGKPILDYTGWEWVPRDPATRNHRNKVFGWSRPDKAQFVHIDSSNFNFSQGFSDADWIKGGIFWASRTQPSYAEPALPGEALFTRHDNFVITYNIAQPGDWRITTMQGDQYYLSDREFKNRYHSTPIAKNCYSPKGAPQPMVEIAKSICLRAPWGAMQYLSSGSVLTQDSNGRLYGIHAINRKSYRKVTGPQVTSFPTP